jgi:competence ComEA-like helix-hairpin-helix protein
MLNFTRGQRNGLIVLSILIILFIVSPLFIDFFEKDYKLSFSEFEKEIINATIPKKENIQKQPIPNISYFDFNPNTASERDLYRLGLSKKQVKQILNYRQKNGKFYKKADFRKIYAIDTETYRKLEAYIVIPNNTKYKKSISKKQAYPSRRLTHKKLKIIEINSASVDDLQEIKGLGPVISKRIVKYRTILGGFIETKQLMEVYGIDEEKYQQIKTQITCNQEIKLINANFATTKDFEKHPYFSKKQAKKIVKNRTFKGRFKNLNDFKTRLHFSDELIKKIKDYLTF